MGRAALCAWLAVVTCGPLALAQEKVATPPGDDTPPAEPPAEAPAEGTPDATNAPTPSEKAAVSTAPTEIFAVPRRFTLKRRRVELVPTYNVTINNPLLTHHGFGGQINFYISEALFIGLEGTYYYRQPIRSGDRYFLVGANQRVIPSVNQYNWSAFLDFGYVFAEGKYALFNRVIAHWDAYLMGGVGVFNTQIVPRDDPTSRDIWVNYNFAGLLPGIGAHMWFNRWLALDVYVKNYIFADPIEPAQRVAGDCTVEHVCDFPGENPNSPDPANPARSARSQAQSLFTFDVTFGFGLSFFLPPGFDYRTPR